jgi:hypothetical protein
MAKQAAAMGTRWQGLVKEGDPLDIPPEASPDCANAFFFDGAEGQLGPRFGKEEAGRADVAAGISIVGVMPYRVPFTTHEGVRLAKGGLLAALSDGRTILIPSIGGPIQGLLAEQRTSGQGGASICGGVLDCLGAKIAICWDGVRFKNEPFPGGITGYPWCAYKTVDPCTGGNKPGFVYRFNCARLAWDLIEIGNDCFFNDAYFLMGLPPAECT